MVDRFSQDCTEVGGKGSAALRAAFQAAAAQFVSRFHNKRKDRLMALLDAETWRSADVPAVVQQFVAKVSASGGIPELQNALPGSTEPFLTVGKEKYIVIGYVPYRFIWRRG